jgi:ATP-dependent RNA helicase DDX54/DBP10
LVGGDNIEHHFEQLAANPDIIIASPGRLLHLLNETGVSLSQVEMLIFDEADRLFEMGFQAEIEAIIKTTPTSRQTLLFSATLPKLLLEFTRAGLRNPEVIRVGSCHKIFVVFLLFLKKDMKRCDETIFRIGTSDSM